MILGTATGEKSRRPPSISSPTATLAFGNSDPFNAAVLPITAFSHGLINLVTRYHTTMIWPAESASKLCFPAMTHWWEDVKGSISQKHHLASLLGLGAIIKLHLQQPQTIEDRRSLVNLVLRHKNAAIESLIQQLSVRIPTLSVLQSVIHLMCLEGYANNFQNSRIHYSAMQKIVQSMGGVSVLPWFYKEYVLFVCLNVAVILREAPYFRTEDWDPGSVTLVTSGGLDSFHFQRRLLRALIERHGSQRDLSPMLSNSVNKIFGDLRELFVADELQLTVPRDCIIHGIDRWIQLKLTSCHQRLYEYRLHEIDPLVVEITSYKISGNAKGNAFQKRRRKFIEACACLGASFAEIVTMWGIREQMDRWSVFDSWGTAFQVCSDALLRDTWDLEDIEDDRDATFETILMLWATVMTMIADRMQLQASAPRRRHYRVVLNRLMSSLGVYTISQVKQVCVSILWSDAVMLPALQALLDADFWGI
jgi:hypothetical protein